MRAAERLATGVITVDKRSFPFDSAEGSRARARNRHERVRVHRAARRTARSRARWCSAATRPRKDSRRFCAARRSPAACRVEAHGSTGDGEYDAHKRQLERLAQELGLDAELGGPVPRAEVPPLFARSHVLINNMRAGAPDKVVYEAAASCLPVLASNPIFDDLLPPELRFDRDDPAGLAERLRTLDRRRRPELARARRGEPLGRALGRRRAGYRGGAMKRGVILHLQKVAGISGSEAHLLALLPKLRERGWDVRMLMLHENEPGAWEFARALDGARCSARRDSAARRRRPDRVRPARRVPRAHAAGDPAHASRARRGVRAARRNRGAGAGPLHHEARLQRVPRGAVLRLRRPRRSRRSRTCTSRSRVGSFAYLEDVEGFDGESFEIVHYGIDPDGEPVPYAGAAPRLLCVGRLIPIKGHIVLLRAFAEAKKRAAGPPARHRGPRSARAGAEGGRGRARHRRLGALPRARSARSRRRSSTRPSSSSRRWARDSAWSRSRRWSGRGR